MECIGGANIDAFPASDAVDRILYLLWFLDLNRTDAQAVITIIALAYVQLDFHYADSVENTKYPTEGAEVTAPEPSDKEESD